ncbi:MAG: hypothetical protein KBC91_00740 [Candidatus Omnitrophica bacterium]|nr:hypothetical protein [Candidatus Omnitrophota bacterium]
MKFEPKNPPRKFKVGDEKLIEISDCGQLELSPDEQVTFVTPSGKEYDVARKNWGFYATPSVNGRLARQGFKTALVRNSHGMVYIMIVDIDRRQEFETYMSQEKSVIEAWLDER